MVKRFGNPHFVYRSKPSPMETYTIARTVGDKCKTIVSTRRICVFIVLRISPTEMWRTITKLYQNLDAWSTTRKEHHIQHVYR